MGVNAHYEDEDDDDDSELGLTVSFLTVFGLEDVNLRLPVTWSWGSLYTVLSVGAVWPCASAWAQSKWMMSAKPRVRAISIGDSMRSLRAYDDNSGRRIKSSCMTSMWPPRTAQWRGVSLVTVVINLHWRWSSVAVRSNKPLLVEIRDKRLENAMRGVRIWVECKKRTFGPTNVMQFVSKHLRRLCRHGCGSPRIQGNWRIQTLLLYVMPFVCDHQQRWDRSYRNSKVTKHFLACLPSQPHAEASRRPQSHSYRRILHREGPPKSLRPTGRLQTSPTSKTHKMLIPQRFLDLGLHWPLSKSGTSYKIERYILFPLHYGQAETSQKQKAYRKYLSSFWRLDRARSLQKSPFLLNWSVFTKFTKRCWHDLSTNETDSFWFQMVSNWIMLFGRLQSKLWWWRHE